MKPTSDFEDLLKIMNILRKECPWDRKQTHQSIKDHLIEEAYETTDAIDRNDVEGLKRELGDLLLHVVFHSRMAAEDESFTIDDVIYALQEKLIRRHPHVFGDAEVEDEQEVRENWETIKMTEGRNSLLDGIPATMPALIYAQRMQQKAGSAGFDWQKSAEGKRQVWDKLEEELTEFEEAYKRARLNKQHIAEEFGDLLFSIVNAGRFLGLQAEDALRLTNKKFKRRFRYIEKHLLESGRSVQEASLEEMEKLWQQAKDSE